MTTYRDAVRRLQIIYNECSPELSNKKQQEQNMDDFTRLKRQLHMDVKACRQLLKDRDELSSIKQGTKELAEISHRIRTRIKQCREDAQKLQALQKKEASKTKVTPEEVQKNKDRDDIVALVFKHIEEVEQLEKKRIADKLAVDRSALFAGAAPVKIDMVQFKDGKPPESSAYDSTLPEIEDDPEVAHGLQQLQQNNRDLDLDLDQIQANVGQLKEIALNMERELDKQNTMLDQIDRKVEKAQDHMDNVNLKMKDALDKMMKGDKFVVNCILLCVVLGLAGFISTQLM